MDPGIAEAAATTMHSNEKSFMLIRWDGGWEMRGRCAKRRRSQGGAPEEDHRCYSRRSFSRCLGGRTDGSLPARKRSSVKYLRWFLILLERSPKYQAVKNFHSGRQWYQSVFDGRFDLDKHVRVFFDFRTFPYHPSIPIPSSLPFPCRRSNLQRKPHSFSSPIPLATKSFLPVSPRLNGSLEHDDAATAPSSAGLQCLTVLL